MFGDAQRVVLLVDDDAGAAHWSIEGGTGKACRRALHVAFAPKTR
jgi:hypothetical protein